MIGRTLPVDPLSHRQGSPIVPAPLLVMGAIAMLYGGQQQAITPDMSDTVSSLTEKPTPIERDADLMRRIAGGEPGACREVVDRHLSAVHGFAWRMLGDNHEAEDVAQEAFLKLWRQARKWQPKAQISTWLRRVAYNACIDRLRKLKPTDDIHDMPLPDTGPNPEVQAVQASVSAQVMAAIEELPERQRAALMLAHYDGLGNIETAAAMETTVEAVESLLGRARRTLKKSLASVHAEETGGENGELR